MSGLRKNPECTKLPAAGPGRVFIAYPALPSLCSSGFPYASCICQKLKASGLPLQTSPCTLRLSYEAQMGKGFQSLSATWILPHGNPEVAFVSKHRALSEKTVYSSLHSAGYCDYTRKKAMLDRYLCLKVSSRKSDSWVVYT